MSPNASKLRLLLCTVGCVVGIGINQPLWSQSPPLHPPTLGDHNLGKSIYNAKCAPCHGEDGKGEGVESALLFPKPRNFSSGVYKFRSTETGTLPTDEDLSAVITNGLPGTSMPSWKKWIRGDSLSAVIAYVKSFSPRFRTESSKRVIVPIGLPTSANSISRGRDVYDKLLCASCHGADGTGKNATASDLRDVWDDPVPIPNLKEPWNFRGGMNARDVYLRFKTGVDGSPMPSYAGSASEEEMWHLANYVLSLARKPAWEMNEQELVAFYAGLNAAAKKDPVKRGEYLVNSIGCADCHSPIGTDHKFVRSMMFAGGQRWTMGPYGEFVTYNLTSDRETGLGSWTDDQIKTFVTKGIRRDGSRMLPFPMPWTSYASLKEDDLNAIVAYLRTLPPVYNKIPEPKPLNFFSYMWGKFKMLILKEDFPGYVYPGNAGTAKLQQVSEIRP